MAHTSRKGDKSNEIDNTKLVALESNNSREIVSAESSYLYLYPSLDDPLFNVKIALRKEFYDTRYEGKQNGEIEDVSEALCNADFELAPHQMFVRNFMSFQTPYNGLLLYHGLGSGKTCSAISVAEEMRDYMKQMGITQRIIVVASPNVQENFIMQLFDERKLKEIDGLWNIRACTGNKYLKEINPMNMKGLSKERVVAQVRRIINSAYLFMGYLELANYIDKKGKVDSDLPSEKLAAISKAKLQKHFENRLIIIDEVHNIRMTDDNKDKRVAVEVERLVENVKNLRLLLLSATPMYNSYKEIVWLLNLLNKNDRRATFEAKDVFVSDGSFKVSKSGEETGKELLMRKATGYVSFVRGENPYIFPYRIWPSDFAPEHTFAIKQKPSIQMNGQPILASSEVLNVLSIYLCDVGKTQSEGYDYIIERLKSGDLVQAGPKGRVMPSFENMESVGYPLLQRPLEALNIVYPDERLGLIESKIDPKDIVGKGGLNRLMISTDTASPAFRGNFEYRTDKYGRIFSPEKIGDFSGKIKNICDNVKSSNGVILIYSQYIDAGLIPVALALEEIGMTRAGRASLFKTPPMTQVDALTFKPKTESKQFTPARYVMITGTESLSPNNVEELKMATNSDNIYGEKVKVILISQAGAEGLDFKFIRQVHILEPWYNMNRPEQIIGRAVRSCSHKDLPFSERNVEIYLYGTTLPNEREEAADLYLYRLAEIKALQIGNVARVLKETAVDCILNTAQQGFTVESMNKTVTQKLSCGKSIKYQVGDRPYSSTCDYMKKCEYRCVPNALITDKEVVLDTYNEAFIVMNNDKIIQNIRRAFKERFYFKKEALISEINATRNYPILQINSALGQLVGDRNEYVTDMYNRLGRIVNIGNLYLFQPIEINNPNISIYDRSVPVEFKHGSVSFEIKPEEGDEKQIKIKATSAGAKVLAIITQEYADIYKLPEKDAKQETWNDFARGAIKKLIDSGYTADIVDTVILHHLVESLKYDDFIDLLAHLETIQINNDVLVRKLKAYISGITMKANKYEGMLLQQAGKRVLLVRPDNKSKPWEKGGSEDEKDMSEALAQLITDIVPFGVKTGNVIGFMSSFKKQFMVYKYRDVNAKGTKGARCDQARKNDVIAILNELFGDVSYSATTTVPRPELCITHELLLRIMNLERKNGKRWFLTPGEAVAIVSDGKA
jgi:hypothetical protein